MRPVNLAELRTQYAGSRVQELVAHHLSRQSQSEREKGVEGTVILLPVAARPLAGPFVEHWNGRLSDSTFWQRDTAEVFDEILADARMRLEPLGLHADDDAAFNLFNLVVMTYASRANAEPRQRAIMGIKGAGIPWPSAVALIYPLTASVYLASTAPTPTLVVIGYGLSSLGYLLFGAGIVAGTYRVLGLTTRWQVFGAAVAVFALGTVLVNAID